MRKLWKWSNSLDGRIFWAVVWILAFTVNLVFDLRAHSSGWAALDGALIGYNLFYLHLNLRVWWELRKEKRK